MSADRAPAGVIGFAVKSRGLEGTGVRGTRACAARIETETPFAPIAHGPRWRSGGLLYRLDHLIQGGRSTSPHGLTLFSLRFLIGRTDRFPGVLTFYGCHSPQARGLMAQGLNRSSCPSLMASKVREAKPALPPRPSNKRRTSRVLETPRRYAAFSP